MAFASARRGAYSHANLVLKNSFLSDPVILPFLRRTLRQEDLPHLSDELTALGDDAVTRLFALAQEAERHKPVLVKYDGFGHVIDRIETSRAWDELSKRAVELGVISTAYDRKYGALRYS
jgi:putative acyl-CoA dehydrogenase